MGSVGGAATGVPNHRQRFGHGICTLWDLEAKLNRTQAKQKPSSSAKTKFPLAEEKEVDPRTTDLELVGLFDVRVEQGWIVCRPAAATTSSTLSEQDQPPLVSTVCELTRGVRRPVAVFAAEIAEVSARASGVRVSVDGKFLMALCGKTLEPEAYRDSFVQRGCAPTGVNLASYFYHRRCGGTLGLSRGTQRSGFSGGDPSSAGVPLGNPSLGLSARDLLEEVVTNVPFGGEIQIVKVGPKLYSVPAASSAEEYESEEAQTQGMLAECLAVDFPALVGQADLQRLFQPYRSSNEYGLVACVWQCRAPWERMEVHFGTSFADQVDQLLQEAEAYGKLAQ